METNSLSDLTNMLKMSADILQATVSSLTDEQKNILDKELLKKGYKKQMEGLKKNIAKFNKMEF